MQRNGSCRDWKCLTWPFKLRTTQVAIVKMGTKIAAFGSDESATARCKATVQQRTRCCAPHHLSILQQRDVLLLEVVQCVHIILARQVAEIRLEALPNSWILHLHSQQTDSQLLHAMATAS